MREEPDGRLLHSVERGVKRVDTLNRSAVWIGVRREQNEASAEGICGF